MSMYFDKLDDPRFSLERRPGPESRPPVGPRAPAPDPHAGETIPEYFARTGREVREGLAKLDESTERLLASASVDQRANDAAAEQLIEKRADVLRRQDPSLSKQQAFAKALEAEPALYERAVRHARGVAARVDETAITRGELAGRTIDERATALSKSAGLTHAQAVARTLEEHPELYRQVRAGQLAKLADVAASAAPIPGSSAAAGAAWSAIEKAAGDLRAGDSDLSEQQAVAKALEENPELYATYRGANS